MLSQHTNFHAKYEALATKARDAGLVAEIVRLNGGFERLSIQVPTTEGNVDLDFRINDQGYFAFNFPQVLQFEELNMGNVIQDLATLSIDSERDLTRWLETAANRALTRSEWWQEELQARQVQLTQYGWQFVDENEATNLSTRFAECIESRQWPPLGRLSNLSVPQMSWNIRHVNRNTVSEIYTIECEYIQALMHTFRQLLRPDECMIATERHGEPVLFFPHQCSFHAIKNHWWVDVLPLERDVAFFDKTREFGYFGHYLSGTVTAFGDKLVSLIQSSKSRVLTSPIGLPPPTLPEWQLLFAESEGKGWSRASDRQEAQFKKMIPLLPDVDFLPDLDSDKDTPICVWDVSAITDSVLDTVAIEKAVITTLTQAMSRHSSDGTVWLAFSEPYPVCRLEVPIKFTEHDSSSWAIQMISRFAKSSFVRSDFKEGIICHNLRGKLILFGAGMSSESLPLPHVGPD